MDRIIRIEFEKDALSGENIVTIACNDKYIGLKNHYGSYSLNESDLKQLLNEAMTNKEYSEHLDKVAKKVKKELMQ